MAINATSRYYWYYLVRAGFSFFFDTRRKIKHNPARRNEKKAQIIIVDLFSAKKNLKNQKQHKTTKP